MAASAGRTYRASALGCNRALLDLQRHLSDEDWEVGRMGPRVRSDYYNMALHIVLSRKILAQ